MKIFFRLLLAVVLIALLLMLSVSRCAKPLGKHSDSDVAIDSSGESDEGTEGENGAEEQSDSPDTSGMPENDKNREFRAAWVATVNNLDFPSRSGMSSIEMKNEIDLLLGQTLSLGLNAVVLQVRPTADAIYRSDIFPWSAYLTGEQGRAPDDGFDPLAYWIEKAHTMDIELHAWLNPYRVTHVNQKITNVDMLAQSNPARINPNWVAAYSGALYFDPGIPEVRQMIIDCVREIILRYDIDGIHMDDYFYPARDFDDETTYLQYGSNADKDEWRRENINNLVSSVHQTIKSMDPGVSFGISPSGVWQNTSTNSQGSDTNGFSHYLELAADSRKWILEGWVDYICPQIYWYIGFDSANYETLLHWWGELCDNSDVKLYIGHAAYRENPPESERWEGEMIRQLELNEAYGLVSGDIFFRISFLDGVLGEQLRDYYAARPIDNQSSSGETSSSVIQEQPVMIMEALTVALPAADVTVSQSAGGYNILGTSIPGLPLYLNGDPVENRTPEGFFSVFARLETGENRFEFSQPGQTVVTRSINKTAPPSSTGDSEITPPEAVTESESPSTQPPTEIAPTETSTEQSPSESTPSPSPTSIFYGTDEPYYATIESELTWLYPNRTTSGGSMWHAVKGQRDRVVEVSIDGAWVKLSNGYWISGAGVTLEESDSVIENVMGNGSFCGNEHANWVAWSSDENPVMRLNYDKTARTVTAFFGLQTELPPMPNRIPPDDSIFEAYSDGINSDGTPYVTLTLKEGIEIDGFDTLYAGSELQLRVKLRRTLFEDPNKPFNGFTFVIDPGHGGDSSGALGPMGADLAEKEIALTSSKKLAESLERMGAKIILTRNDDSELSLEQRNVISYASKPDIFISMHANSIDETVNATNISGITFWYRNATTEPLSELFARELHSINPNTTRQNVSNQGNLYVCRPAWTPSIIVEIGFMCNIDDFSWMIDERNLEKLAEGLTNTMLKYYGA